MLTGSQSTKPRRVSRPPLASTSFEWPFLWLHLNDAPGPDSKRGLIERNAIALLSGYRCSAADGPSAKWLGHHSDRSEFASPAFGITTMSTKPTIHGSST